MGKYGSQSFTSIYLHPWQSAYREHFFTESALLKIHDDIIVSMDKGEVTVADTA